MGSLEVMERGSTKLSRRLDEEMNHEAGSLIQSGQTETRTDQSLVQEGLLPDEQPVAGAPSAHVAPGPGQLSDDEIELRSELARVLEPHVFPARRDALVECARRHDASAAVTKLLDGLDPESTFQTVAAIWEAAGGPMEPHP